MSEFKPIEVAWAYDLGVIAPHKLAFRVVVTQVLEGKRQNDIVGGEGYYYTNTYFLPVSFGTWRLIDGGLFTHAHRTHKDAVEKIPSRIEMIKELKL